MAGYYDRDRNPRNPTTGAPTSAPTAAGTMNHVYSHHGNVAEYQVSGFPFVQRVVLSSDQEKVLTFPYVTQWIQFEVDGGEDCAISFSESGQEGQVGSGEGTNYFVVKSAVGAGDATTFTPSTNRFPIRCAKVFLSDLGSSGCTVTVIAGLTAVRSSEFPDISGLKGVGTAADTSTSVR